MGRGRGSASLVTRLFLIVTVAMLPVLGVAAYDAFELRENSRDEAVRSLGRSLDSLYGQQALLTENTRLLLSTLSKTDAARRCDSAALGPLLSDLLAENPLYVALLAFDPSGEMIAVSSDAQKVSIRDRSYYADVIRRREFTVGEFAVSRTTGKETIHFAYPVIPETGRGLSCILVAAYDLGYYGKLFGAERMAGGGIVEVFDRRGIRLFRFPEDASEGVGETGGDQVMNLVNASPLNAMRLASDVFPGQITASRLVDQDDSGSADFLLLLRYPEELAWAGATSLLWRSAAMIACSLALSFALLRVLSYFAIDSQLKQVADAARRFGSGDFGRLSGVKGGATELVAISAALDEMADGLETRRRERDRAEAALRGSLAEKEILLKEIHHRVKNNFQVVSSLLNLQAGTISDPAALEAFEASQNRIKSMSLIHEKLYHSESLSRIDFSDYLASMAQEISAANYLMADRVRIELDIESVEIPVDSAIPLGLILNEVITNAFKYAFPGEGKGRIRVSLRRLDGPESRAELRIEDDGVGLDAAETGHDAGGGLGRELIKALVSQLEGSIAIDGGEGTRYVIDFPLGR